MLRYDKHVTLDEMARSLKDEYVRLHATVIEQQAEIERLREALDSICAGGVIAHDIARAALGANQ